MTKDKLGLIILIAVFLLATLLVPLSCPARDLDETETSSSPTSAVTTSRTTSRTTSLPTTPPASSSDPSDPTDSQPEGEETLPGEGEEVQGHFSQIAPAVVSVQVSIPASSLYAKREEFFSGLIVDESGMVVTTFSLLERALDYRGRLLPQASIKIYVRGSTRVFPASLLGYRSSVDVALLKIGDAGETLFPAVSLAREPVLEVGSRIFGIGYPPLMVEEGGLAAGYITSLYRTSYEEDGSPVGLLETSIPTQPIYSGGPLVNREGEVVALTSGYLKRIYVQHLGYAVPSPVVLDAIARILDQPEGLEQARAELGITVLGDQDAGRLREMFNYPAGLYISGIKDESAAYTAGLNEGDILQSINGQPMEVMRDLLTFMDGQAVGTLTELMVFRPSDGSTLVRSCYLLEESP